MVRGHEAAGNAPLAARGRAGLRFPGPMGNSQVMWPSEIGSMALLGAGSQRDRLKAALHTTLLLFLGRTSIQRNGEM